MYYIITVYYSHSDPIRFTIFDDPTNENNAKLHELIYSLKHDKAITHITIINERGEKKQN